MTDRFPDVDWFCDYCGAHLNSQTGFLIINIFGSVRNVVEKVVSHLIIFLNFKGELNYVKIIYM